MEFGLSAEGLEERQRQLPFVREGPRRTAKKGNGNFFLSAEGREGPRRTATATSASFVRGGPRRTAKNGNGNFFLSAEGHGGPRRTATSFCPRRATKDREEGQRQLLFVRGGPRRTTKNGKGNFSFYLSAEGHGGPRRTATSFCPRRATKDREEGNGNFFLSAEGREEGQRQLLFVRGGPLRAAENTFCG